MLQVSFTFATSHDISGTADARIVKFCTQVDYTVFQKKTSTHIIGYKLRNSCPILIIFDTKIPHII